MPAVAARDYRCSWEIPYDFHPRIHAYPGVTSAVRAYVDGTATSALPENHHGQQEPKKGKVKENGKCTCKPRHYRLHPTLPQKPKLMVVQALSKETAAPSNQTTCTAQSVGNEMRHPLLPPPSAPSSASPTRRRPQWRTAKPNSITGNNSDSTSHNATPVKSTAMLNEEATSTFENRSKAAIFIVQRRPFALTRFRQQLLPPPPPQQLHQSQPTTVPVGQASVLAVPQPSPRRTMLFPQPRYSSRTRPRYTLSPPYAVQQRQNNRQPMPLVHLRDGYSNAASACEVHMNADVLQQATSRGFVKKLIENIAMQSGSYHKNIEDVAPRAVFGSYIDTADSRTFYPAVHNLNAYTHNVFLNGVTERTAHLQAMKRRRQAQLILQVAPLTKARQEVSDAGGTSVLDSGHVTDPIYVASERDNVNVQANVFASNSVDETAFRDDCACQGEEATAVIVQPFAKELPASVGTLREGGARRLRSKGREWDRQAAIRAVAGPRAQEAIVDLGIDPRYRLPGDFLLRQN